METNIKKTNASEITAFLKTNRIQMLHSSFTKHKITIEDLMIWTEQNVNEYCVENKFATHVKCRLRHGIKQLQHKNGNEQCLNTKINKLQQTQIELYCSMQKSFTKLFKELDRIHNSQKVNPDVNTIEGSTNV